MIERHILLIICIIVSLESLQGQKWSSFKKESNSDKYHDYFFEAGGDSLKKSLIIKIVNNYQKSVVPLQAQHCPCIPSCSNYTLHFIKKRGLLLGIIAGVERLFIRENYSMVDNEKYSHINWNSLNDDYVYDPFEANDIFSYKDWRYIDPDFIDDLVLSGTFSSGRNPH